MGWIADEVEDIIPEIVVEDDEGYKHIAYSHATPLLAEAIKEVRTELIEMFTKKMDNLVTTFEDKINELKYQNELLKKEILTLTNL